MTHNEITGAVIDSAMRVHTRLGPGLLESAYEACLLYELRKRGLKVLSQVALPVIYDGVEIDVGYRIDLLVEDAVIVELKAVERVLPIHEVQLLSYFEAERPEAGPPHQLKDGIMRLANNL